jgi:ABC-2 type transport system ATP-binding protein
MIEMQQVWKKYRDAWALRDVSLEAADGRVVGVLGENGSGKSSLFKILAGVVRPSQGVVRVMGVPVGIETRGLTAYLPEINPYYGWMSVAQQLEFLSRFYAGWDAVKATELCRFMKVPTDQKVGTLSKGQVARLKVAAAFSWPSRVVLMDEPLGGIDPPSRRRILATLFEQFRAAEQTILISTHLVDEVEGFVDSVLFLSAGEIVLRGEVDQLREDRGQSLAEMFEEVAS